MPPTLLSLSVDPGLGGCHQSFDSDFLGRAAAAEADVPVNVLFARYPVVRTLLLSHLYISFAERQTLDVDAGTLVNLGVLSQRKRPQNTNISKSPAEPPSSRSI